MYMDADILITNSNHTVEDFLVAASATFVHAPEPHWLVLQDGMEINSGLFIISGKLSQSIAFLEAWWALGTHTCATDPTDQGQPVGVHC